jgi:hypothetical protein
VFTKIRLKKCLALIPLSLTASSATLWQPINFALSLKFYADTGNQRFPRSAAGFNVLCRASPTNAQIAVVKWSLSRRGCPEAENR